MVTQFSIANYRSIFQIQTLKFRATTLVSEDKEIDKRNIANLDDNKILKTIGIYGANASGKSNIIKAFSFFKMMVNNSLDVEELAKNEISPFKQSSDVVDNSGYFEIVLIIDSKKYRYGFTLDKEANIQAEWLFGPAEKNETYYFTRKHDELTINPLWFQEGDDLPKEKLRNEVLFLTFCASYDGNISRSIKNYISRKITIDNNFRNRPISIRANPSQINTNNLIQNGRKEIVLNWMKEIGLSYSDVQLNKVEYGGKVLGNYVTLTKNIYNSKGEINGSTIMNLDDEESEGTRKFYSYIGKLNQKFEEGGLFISDEIDSNFHPNLLRKLIFYFNNSSINRANAQLLFTSHDTNLMDPQIMRRDQFYFTEKSLLDETILYSLSDLKGVRNNADFARQYLAGIYGALPILGNLLEEQN